MKKVKKPLSQRKWVWVVVGLLAIVGFQEVQEKIDGYNQDRATANASSVLKGMVKVPETYFKSKELVEEEFESVGLKAKFVVENFDEAADTNNRMLNKGECNQISSTMPNVEYFDSDKVGEKYGYYAKKGTTIVIGYSDHDYDGRTKSEETSSLTEESSSETTLSSKETSADTTTKESNEEIKDITVLSATPSAQQETILRTLTNQQFKENYPYKGSKIHSVMGTIQNWTQSGDKWYYKANATINNAYDSKRDAVIEVFITPTGPESGIIEITDY